MLRCVSSIVHAKVPLGIWYRLILLFHLLSDNVQHWCQQKKNMVTKSKIQITKGKSAKTVNPKTNNYHLLLIVQIQQQNIYRGGSCTSGEIPLCELFGQNISGIPVVTSSR